MTSLLSVGERQMVTCFEDKMRKRVDAAELPCSEDHIVLGPGGDGCR